MSEATELTLEDLHNATSSELTAAAAAESRIKSGSYLAKATKVFLRRNADDADFDAGRATANFALQLYEADATTKVGQLYLKASWEPRYNKADKLDNPSKRFTELRKALGVTTNNPADVVEAAQQQMFGVRVRETVQVSSDDLHDIHADKAPTADGMVWVDIRADDDTDVFEHYSDLGYESKSMIDRVFKAK